MLRSILLLVALAVIVLMGVPAHAQKVSAQDALIDHLVGQWVLQGTMGGQKSTFDIDAQRVMQGSYLRLHEVSRGTIVGGGAYEATLYLSWSKPKAQYGCIFMDNGGEVGTLNLGFGKFSGTSIPLAFKGDGEDFHTIMVYSPASDSWTWSMYSIRQGKHVPFALLTLTRQSAASAGHS